MRIRLRRGAAPPRLTCAEVVELVTDYLDGSLAPNDAAHFSAHLADCDGCSRYVEQIRMTSAELRRLELGGLSDAGCAQLLAAFRDWSRDG